LEQTADNQNQLKGVVMTFFSRLGRCAAVAVMCGLAFTPVAAKADVQTIRKANTAYWLGVGAAQHNYKESVTPTPNSQHGWVTSIGGGLDYMAVNDLYLSADASVSLGADYYKGAYLISGTPYEGTTHATITTFDGKIGRGFALSNEVMATPYVNLGFRYWDRNLGNQQVENYYHFAALAGAMVQYSPAARWVLTTYGAVGGTFGAHMKTDGLNFNLGNAAIYKAGGKISYGLTDRWDVFTSLDFDHFRYVRSKVVSGYYEPSSFTNDTILRVGVAYHMW